MNVKNPNELTYGMLGFFAGKVGDVFCKYLWS